MSTSRVRRFPCSDGVTGSLAFYRPDAVQRRHFHDYTQFSLLLSGEMLERHGTREWSLAGTAMGLKPRGLSHENLWGREGVLIFSLKLETTRLEDMLPPLEPGWWPASPSELGPELVRGCVEARDRAAREEAMIDCLSLPLPPPPKAFQSVPHWLARAKEAIRAEPDMICIEEMAKEAGVHRVRFSALFKACFGLPPSVYRRRVMTARAIAGMVGGKAPLTAIAHDAGFSDQAHLARSVRHMTGLAPSRLRALLT